ncbi:MAG TPA: response regulator transcription factor [Aggregatilinea sp.]|jgi:two-component system KDP operon response regulator KdpE|uniref:response regulator transcription factor n=1 Tax=Aggregatilinea sp. TaxID=2806333 RepID=UPI002C7E713E|nr:response regulator transcription factor [Aggregatilinea sp.]HML20806.1 response regulator transcription factor [Aggregatilinea sp.]
MSTKVLVVEDDVEMNRLLQIDLKRHGYEVYTATNGLDGLRLFHEVRPNLVVLDVALPGMDGMTVCQRIRELSNVPILIMTAHAVTEEEMAEGLNLGADEYLIKPLRNLEFHARINALMRRAQLSDEGAQGSINYSDDYLVVDVDARRVGVNGSEIRLTPTEFKLLATFIRHKGQVLTFQQLLEQVWGYEYNTEHHYPRIYVSHLRRKIEPDAKNPTYIQNEYGVGYRFTGK